MIFKNPNSKRENPFRKIYDSRKFKAILQHKNDLPKFPFLIDVELTNHCNLKCIFCTQQIMIREKGFMSERILEKIVNECSQYGIPLRFIRQGEPFLHKKILDFSKFIKSKALLLHITTNGLTLTENNMRSLVDIGVDSLIFSFQGTTKEEYEIMRNNYQYDELKANILKIVEIRNTKSKPFIHISSTMTNESGEEIDRFVNYWGNIVDSVGIGKTNLSRLSLYQIKSLETMKKFEMIQKQETIEKIYRPCTEIYQKLSIDWNGKITCCCEDFDNFLTVGDITQSTLHYIWNNSKKLKIFRELLDRNLHQSLTLCNKCYHTYKKF